MKTDLISRRSFLSVVGAVGAAAALTACGGSASSTASSTAASEAAGESVELIVFAAASLTETLNAIAQDYSVENPGVTSASTLIPPVLSRPRSRRALTATSSSLPVRSR